MNRSALISGHGPMLIRYGAALLCAVGVAILLRETWLFRTASPTAAVKTNHESVDSALNMNDACQHLPGADKIFLLMKTGAREIYEKLPVHLMTIFQCVPNFMIFSDLEQDFGDAKIYDAIAHVTGSSRNLYSDFNLYDTIATWSREGRNLKDLPSGWDLDKWKFLPMLYQAFASAPQDTEWFVVIEPDTSLSWLNLLLLLKTMDPQKPYYRGSQNALNGMMFAHGGSGIIISRGAADRIVAARNSDSGGTEVYDRKWEDRIFRIPFGDVILAQVFSEAGVAHTQGWPLTQGESLDTLEWTHQHWCTPSVTWHHVPTEQVDALWRFQNEWANRYGWQKPYLYRDLFEHVVQPYISTNKTSWNNLSNHRKYQKDDKGFRQFEQYERAAVETPVACAAACARQPEGECLQWRWTAGECHLGKELRFGSSDAHLQVHWTSGWLPDRIERFKQRLEGCETSWQALAHFADDPEP